MKNKRVLITGGAGLIGSHIADLVAQEEPREIRDPRQLRARAAREPSPRRGAVFRLTIVEGDIRDRALLATACEGIDVVFHQAAIRITQCAEEPRLAFDVLADGTFNVLEAAVKAGVSKVVAASSASVLGLADSFPTTEAIIPTTTARSTARRRRSTKGCCAASPKCTGSTTSRCATSMSTDRAWTCTAPIPRCSSAGWSASRPARRRSSTATERQTMDFVACARYRARQHPRGEIRCHR